MAANGWDRSDLPAADEMALRSSGRFLPPSPLGPPGHLYPTVTNLSDLVRSIWLGMSRHDETQLTTAQKELLYDTLEADPVFAGNEEPLNRWWRE